jgi:formylglycine-generating enzyme required for sulfatase activity
MKMVVIPAGSFWMGSDNRYRWESPRHRIWLDSFAIATTAVTRGEYARFLADTRHAAPAGWNDPCFSGEDQPVVGVNWFAAGAYCEWFSELMGKSYRLPTEAEWEKACRGGLENAEYSWGDESPDSFDYFGGEWKGPKPGGEWRANAYGLFNMGDNVHEWCADWYADNYYASSPERNPTGPESGTRRVSRGGSWRHQVKASRAAHRSSLPPSFAYTDYGFRLVCSV